MNRGSMKTAALAFKAVKSFGKQQSEYHSSKEPSESVESSALDSFSRLLHRRNSKEEEASATYESLPVLDDQVLLDWDAEYDQKYVMQKEQQRWKSFRFLAFRIPVSVIRLEGNFDLTPWRTAGHDPQIASLLFDARVGRSLFAMHSYLGDEPVPIRDVLQILSTTLRWNCVLQLAAGLARLHARGVGHGNVSPDTVVGSPMGGDGKWVFHWIGLENAKLEEQHPGTIIRDVQAFSELAFECLGDLTQSAEGSHALVVKRLEVCGALQKSEAWRRRDEEGKTLEPIAAVVEAFLPNDSPPGVWLAVSQHSDAASEYWTGVCARLRGKTLKAKENFQQALEYNPFLTPAISHLMVLQTDAEKDEDEKEGSRSRSASSSADGDSDAEPKATSVFQLQLTAMRTELARLRGVGRSLQAESCMAVSLFKNGWIAEAWWLATQAIETYGRWEKDWVHLASIPYPAQDIVPVCQWSAQFHSQLQSDAFTTLQLVQSEASEWLNLTPRLRPLLVLPQVVAGIAAGFGCEGMPSGDGIFSKGPAESLFGPFGETIPSKAEALVWHLLGQDGLDNNYFGIKANDVMAQILCENAPAMQALEIHVVQPSGILVWANKPADHAHHQGESSLQTITLWDKLCGEENISAASKQRVAVFFEFCEVEWDAHALKVHGYESGIFKAVQLLKNHGRSRSLLVVNNQRHIEYYPFKTGLASRNLIARQEDCTGTESMRGFQAQHQLQPCTGFGTSIDSLVFSAGLRAKEYVPVEVCTLPTDPDVFCLFLKLDVAALVMLLIGVKGRSQDEHIQKDNFSILQKTYLDCATLPKTPAPPLTGGARRHFRPERTLNIEKTKEVLVAPTQSQKLASSSPLTVGSTDISAVKAAKNHSHHFRCVIVGGGVAAGYAAQEFVKQRIAKGELLLISSEDVLPYERPALSKGFLKGKVAPPRFNCCAAQTKMHDEKWYAEHGITVYLGCTVISADWRSAKILTDTMGVVSFDYAILCTGAAPVPLTVPGATEKNIHYLRNLKDAQVIMETSNTNPGCPVTIVGGGYLAMEATAALTERGHAITMVLTGSHVMSRLWDKTLAAYYEEEYEAKGVTFVRGATAKAFEGTPLVNKVVLSTGAELEAGFVIICVGATVPRTIFDGQLVSQGRGIKVNGNMQTSLENVYAAGDLCSFTVKKLNRPEVMEHVMHARRSAEHAVKHMMGEPDLKEYDYTPYFYSRIFHFSWDFHGDPNGKMYLGCGPQDYVPTKSLKLCAVWVTSVGFVNGIMVESGSQQDLELAKKVIEVGMQVNMADVTQANTFQKMIIVLQNCKKATSSNGEKACALSKAEVARMLQKLPQREYVHLTSAEFNKTCELVYFQATDDGMRALNGDNLRDAACQVLEAHRAEVLKRAIASSEQVNRFLHHFGGQSSRDFRVQQQDFPSFVRFALAWCIWLGFEGARQCVARRDRRAAIGVHQQTQVEAMLEAADKGHDDSGEQHKGDGKNEGSQHRRVSALAMSLTKSSQAIASQKIDKGKAGKATSSSNHVIQAIRDAAGTSKTVKSWNLGKTFGESSTRREMGAGMGPGLTVLPSDAVVFFLPHVSEALLCLEETLVWWRLPLFSRFLTMEHVCKPDGVLKAHYTCNLPVKVTSWHLCGYSRIVGLIAKPWRLGVFDSAIGDIQHLIQLEPSIQQDIDTDERPPVMKCGLDVSSGVVAVCMGGHGKLWLFGHEQQSSNVSEELKKFISDARQPIPTMPDLSVSESRRGWRRILPSATSCEPQPLVTLDVQCRTGYGCLLVNDLILWNTGHSVHASIYPKAQDGEASEDESSSSEDETEVHNIYRRDQTKVMLNQLETMSNCSDEGDGDAEMLVHMCPDITLVPKMEEDSTDTLRRWGVVDPMVPVTNLLEAWSISHDLLKIMKLEREEDKNSARFGAMLECVSRLAAPLMPAFHDVLKNLNFELAENVGVAGPRPWQKPPEADLMPLLDGPYDFQGPSLVATGHCVVAIGCCAVDLSGSKIMLVLDGRAGWVIEFWERIGPHKWTQAASEWSHMGTRKRPACALSCTGIIGVTAAECACVWDTDDAVLLFTLEWTDESPAKGVWTSEDAKFVSVQTEQGVYLWNKNDLVQAVSAAIVASTCGGRQLGGREGKQREKCTAASCHLHTCSTSQDSNRCTVAAVADKYSLLILVGAEHGTVEPLEFEAIMNSEDSSSEDLKKVAYCISCHSEISSILMGDGLLLLLFANELQLWQVPRTSRVHGIRWGGLTREQIRNSWKDHVGGCPQACGSLDASTCRVQSFTFPVHSCLQPLAFNWRSRVLICRDDDSSNTYAFVVPPVGCRKKLHCQWVAPSPDSVSAALTARGDMCLLGEGHRWSVWDLQNNTKEIVAHKFTGEQHRAWAQTGSSSITKGGVLRVRELRGESGQRRAILQPGGAFHERPKYIPADGDSPKGEAPSDATSGKNGQLGRPGKNRSLFRSGGVIFTDESSAETGGALCSRSIMPATGGRCLRPKSADANTSGRFGANTAVHAADAKIFATVGNPKAASNVPNAKQVPASRSSLQKLQNSVNAVKAAGAFLPSSPNASFNAKASSPEVAAKAGGWLHPSSPNAKKFQKLAPSEFSSSEVPSRSPSRERLQEESIVPDPACTSLPSTSAEPSCLDQKDEAQSDWTRYPVTKAVEKSAAIAAKSPMVRKDTITKFQSAARKLSATQKIKDITQTKTVLVRPQVEKASPATMDNLEMSVVVSQIVKKDTRTRAGPPRSDVRSHTLPPARSEALGSSSKRREGAAAKVARMGLRNEAGRATPDPNSKQFFEAVLNHGGSYTGPAAAG